MDFGRDQNPRRGECAYAIQAFARHADAQVAPLVAKQMMQGFEPLWFSRCCLERTLNLHFAFSRAIFLPWLCEILVVDGRYFGG